jgi:hypothetical protein
LYQLRPQIQNVCTVRSHHCQFSFLSTDSFGFRDVMAWKDIVEVTVVNCAAEINSPLCREHSIESFPTLKVFF